MRCYYCNIENPNDAQFCRSCGKPLVTHDVAWWKEYNMVPVAFFKLLPSNGMSVIIYPLLLISVVFVGLSFFILVYEVFAGGIMEAIPFVIGYFGIGIAVFAMVYPLAGKKAFVNFTRRKRKELLDSDFIERYNTRNDHYVFVARGNSQTHKFGLFDVQSIRLQLAFDYDELKWIEKGKLLSASKNGEKIIIDINGNIYK